MILDTSAIAAIALREPERDEFVRKLATAPIVGVGAPTLVEAAIVLTARLGDGAPRRLGRFIERVGIIIVSFEAAHWQVALEAWLRFGRGRHPAQLNFADCLAYATARVAGRPLLCKGPDFPKTDLALA